MTFNRLKFQIPARLLRAHVVKAAVKVCRYDAKTRAISPAKMFWTRRAKSAFMPENGRPHLRGG